MANSTDKSAPGRQQEMDAGREAVQAAYRDMLEAQQHFRKAAEAAGVDLKEDALEHLRQGKNKADELGREVERYVHEKPLATVGLAFFVGLLVSQLMSRK